MRIPGRVLPALFIAACAGGPGPEPPTFDPCAPLVIVPEAGSSPAERASLESAIGLWREPTGASVTTDDVPGAPRLVVAFRDAPLAFFGIYETSGIAVNRGLTDDGQRSVVLAHELGHAFGLVHVSDPASVMVPGNLRVPPGVHDAEALAALWGACR